MVTMHGNENRDNVMAVITNKDTYCQLFWIIFVLGNAVMLYKYPEAKGRVRIFDIFLVKHIVA